MFQVYLKIPSGLSTGVMELSITIFPHSMAIILTWPPDPIPIIRLMIVTMYFSAVSEIHAEKLSAHNMLQLFTEETGGRMETEYLILLIMQTEVT